MNENESARRIDLGRALFSRRAHSESAPLEEIEMT